MSHYKHTRCFAAVKRKLRRNMSFLNADQKSCNGKLSPVCEYLLKHLPEAFDPELLLQHFKTIESDQDILKKEMRVLIFTVLNVNNLFPDSNVSVHNLSIAGMEDFPLIQKYKMPSNFSIFSKSDLYMTAIQWTFPVLYHNIIKDLNIAGLICMCLISSFKNFNPLLLNIGLLSVVPKGGKYGGFVKVMLHLLYTMCCPNNTMEGALALGLLFYKRESISHAIREKFFEKLNIKEYDCVTWGLIFNRVYPDYTDIHTFFEQVA